MRMKAVAAALALAAIVLFGCNKSEDTTDKSKPGMTDEQTVPKSAAAAKLQQNGPREQDRVLEDRASGRDPGTGTGGGPAPGGNRGD